ncbi:MAG: helix-turn-helix domain-containing protein [Alphaproteobacteria bacterium]
MLYREDFERFKDKDYRDEFVSSLVRSGIAAQIRALRTQAGITQQEFAAVTGKTQSVISRLESTEYGRVSVQTLLDIACAREVALVVKFMSHEDFFDHMGPAALRPDALRVETFSETINRRERPIAPTIGATSASRLLEHWVGPPTQQGDVSLSEDVVSLDAHRKDRFGYSAEGQQPKGDGRAA